MKTIVTILCGWVLLMIVTPFTSFNNECKHIYVGVVQKEVKISWPTMTLEYDGQTGQLPIGKHEGGDLICVKCFHQTRQIIDYGNPYNIIQPPDTVKIKH